MPAKRRGAFSSGTGQDNTSQRTSKSTTPPNMAFSFGASTATPTAAPAAPAFGAPPAFGAAPAPSTFGAAPSPGIPRPAAFGAAPAPSAFGAPAAPPAAGGLFGAPAAAPAAGGLFGSPAPAAGGMFGARPPAPSAFGAAPAGGGLFGAAPAPATGGLFGAPVPAPAAGGFFGAPAPAAGGLFGAPAPAPTAGGLFGAPAPAASAFGVAPQQLAAPAANLAGFMPYSSLPQDQKMNIDTVYQAIMNHKRTILAVSTMAPKLLHSSNQLADAAGGQELPLPVTVKRLIGQVQQLEQQLKSLHGSMMHTKQMYETSTTQAIRNAKWPTEFVAMRVGVTLTNNNASAVTVASSTADDKRKTEEFNRHLKELLDREMTHTDQIYHMPSPYLWQCVEEMEGRSRILHDQLRSLRDTLDISNQVSTEKFDIKEIVQLQEESIWRVAADLTQAHTKIDQLRQMYNLHEKGVNVLEEERQREENHQRQLDQEIRTLMVKTLPSALPAATGQAPATGGGLFGTPAPAPGGGLFGKSPAPASGSLFGTPSTGTSLFGTPAPAPAGGGLFGAAPAPSAFAPAPAAGGLFGAPAAAPAAGGLFGAPAAAPAAGGLFGAPAAAPAAGGLFGAPAAAPAAGGLFGAPAAAPAAGGLFGAPAAAPAAGGLFGAPAAAPAAGGLFGAPAAAPVAGAFGAATPAPAFGAAPAPAAGGLFGSSTAAATPKSKSRSRNGSRRR